MSLVISNPVKLDSHCFSFSSTTPAMLSSAPVNHCLSVRPSTQMKSQQPLPQWHHQLGALLPLGAAAGAKAGAHSKLLSQETKTPKVLLIRAFWNSHPSLVLQPSSLKASRIQNIWKAHGETGGGRGVEVNIAIMKMSQSSFSFLFPDAENRSKEIDFLGFYCSPLFIFYLSKPL